MLSHIEQGLQAVEAELTRATGSRVPLLDDASRHTIGAGGKRLRPQLALLAYLAAGGKTWQRVVPAAAALELVHTATLVHDDINDHSLTRRGRASVHARWGRTFALLTGDFMFASVYAMMAPYGAEINQIMADACVRLVEGETLQAAAAKTGELDRETYQRIIALKTASLFEAAAEIGARLAGADEATAQALRDFGHKLGLAFQIADDILDLVGDPEKLGKPTQVDLPQRRGAVLAQNGRAASARGNGHVAVAAADADPLAALMARLRESGAVELARQQATVLVREARAALASLPESPARAELAALAQNVVDRDH